jgi:hypothetical protein
MNIFLQNKKKQIFIFTLKNNGKYINTSTKIVKNVTNVI